MIWTRARIHQQQCCVRAEGKVGRARTGEVLLGGARDGKIKRPIVLHLGLPRHMQTTTALIGRCHRAHISHQICAQDACLESVCIMAGEAQRACQTSASAAAISCAEPWRLISSRSSSSSRTRCSSRSGARNTRTGGKSPVKPTCAHRAWFLQLEKEGADSGEEPHRGRAWSLSARPPAPAAACHWCRGRLPPGRRTALAGARPVAVSMGV